MSLESLLQPVQWLDEKVLKFYTQQTAEWEEKGRSKYSLAHLYNLTATVANCFFMVLSGKDSYFLTGTGLLAVQSFDFARNMYAPSYEKDVVQDEMIKPPVSMELTRKISSAARLPMIATGIAFMIRGIISFANYIKEKEPQYFIEALYQCSFGYALIGTASSIYVKDNDPKLLQKKPVEEKIYEELATIKRKE